MIVSGRSKNRGNTLLVIIISALILTAALAVAALTSFFLCRSREEIISQQTRMTAKSALAQVLFRVDKRLLEFSQECSNVSMIESSQPVSISWKNVVKGDNGENFVFQNSAAQQSSGGSFAGSFVSVDFSGSGKNISIDNFDNDLFVQAPSSDRYNVPPYSLDLVFNVKNRSYSKRFETVILKNWPYAVCCVGSNINIGLCSAVRGDLCSFRIAPQLSGSNINQSYSPTISIDLPVIYPPVSPDFYPVVNGNLFTASDSPDKISADKPWVSHASDPIYINELLKPNWSNGKKHYGTKGTASSFLSSMLTIAVPDKGKSCMELNDLLVSSNVAVTLHRESLDSSAFGNSMLAPFFEKLSSSLDSSQDEPSSSDRMGEPALPFFSLVKDLSLEGNSVSDMGAAAVSGHSHYIIRGNVMSAAGVVRQSFPGSNNNTADGSLPGINLSNCTLVIDGNLLLVGSQMLDSGRPSPASSGNANRLVPKLTGMNSAIVVTGNIFLMSAEMESSGDNFVIYADGNIILRPEASDSGNNRTDFSGAIVCKGNMYIEPVYNYNSGMPRKYFDLLHVRGAVVCGGVPFEEDELFNSVNDCLHPGILGLNLESVSIDYDPSVISLLHKLIGYPEATIWRELP